MYSIVKSTHFVDKYLIIGSLIQKVMRISTKTDFREWQGKIDVLTGGFPCQPFSVAGKRKGTEDNRYLWPEFKRAIREIRPPWVVGENVAGILSMVQPGKKADMESMPATEHEDKQEFVIRNHLQGP